MLHTVFAFVLVPRCIDNGPWGCFLADRIVAPLLWVIRRKNRELDKIKGTYFHFLVPEYCEEESSDEEWHGKLVALERTIISEARKHNKSLGGQRPLPDA